MSWGAPVTIYDDEDEAALKSRFVELCARYPDRSALEVGCFLFQDLRDPERGAQAGPVWWRDLAIQERIANARRNGGREKADELPTKEQLATELLTLARTARDAKDQVAAYKTAAEVLGYITKQVDKKVEAKGNTADLLAAIAQKLPN